MRRIIYLLLFFAFPTTIFSYDPLLVIVLMVKDEAPVIQQTLEPLIKAGHKHFMMYDTGSTDDTIGIAKTLFSKNGIPDVLIVEEPFIDFSTSRNKALDLTERHFPHAAFMLMIDAEWELINYQGLVDFCTQKQHEPQSYHIRIINDECDYYTGRLIKCGTKTRFEGSAHEELTGIVECVPRDVYIHWKVTSYGKNKSQARYPGDIKKLMGDHEKNPHNPRTVFYIAQSYSCLRDWNNARIWYERRIAMPSGREELFLANYRLGLIYNILGNWDKALAQLLNAYAIQPRRAEPFICIAQRYKELGNKKLCEFFAREALKISYPEFNTLAVEKNLYFIDRYALFDWSLS